MLSRSLTSLGLTMFILVVPLLVACDKNPDGYSVDEFKALPEASLLVPGGEVIRTGGSNGSRAGGNTRYFLDVRTDLDANAVYAFYRTELTARGWTFSKPSTERGVLLTARGHKGNFGFILIVSDPAAARGTDDWGGRTTLYKVTIAAEGKKGE